MRFEADENAPDGHLEADSPGEPEAADAPTADGANEPAASEPTTDLAPVPEAPGTQVDRLTDVLLAADQAAAEILDAARAEAGEFVAETQRSTIERAESLRRETDNLMAQTAELTAKVVELTRATELVMEGFRAELSLDAPEVREETLTPALPEPTPIPPTPEPEPAPIEDVAPEDTTLAPEPVVEEPGVSDELEEDPVLAEEPGFGEATADDEPAESIEEELAPETDIAASPTTEAASVGSAPVEDPPAPEPTPSISDRPAPAPTAAPAPAPAQSDEPKRRGGLFGRFRGRGKDQAPAPTAPEPDPRPEPALTQDAPALDTRSGPVTEGARLIARQMLATGLGEEEVKRQLREQFRLADPQAVLDSLRRNDRDDQSG